MVDQRRPRILLVTRNLPPLVGGMERLNWHLAKQLSSWADVHIVGPQGSAALAPEGLLVREAPLTPLWKFLWRARQLARQEARIWKPDMLLAGSGLAAPLVDTAAKLCGALTAVYVHGLDVAVRHVLYRVVWFRAIRHMDRVIANSRPTAELCRDIGIRDECIGTVHPGVDVPGLDSLSDAGSRFREQQGLVGKHLLLSVGRLSSRKGLREFVNEALPRIVDVYPDTILLVVGDSPSQALHAEGQSRTSIQEAANSVGVGQHLRFLGVITNYAELGAVYSAADLHVFPVRTIPGDPEGFGMVAVEAAAHGLPTVAFATGGVIDAVGEGISGCLVPPDDYEAFARAVIQCHETGIKPSSCVDFARKFGWQEFGAAIHKQLGLIGPSVRR